MTAIMVSNLTITDPEEFQEYLRKSKELAGAYGAKLMFKGRFRERLNGDQDQKQMVVIAEFPNMDAIRSWNGSDAYQALVPLRDRSSVQNMMVYESD